MSEHDARIERLVTRGAITEAEARELRASLSAADAPAAPRPKAAKRSLRLRFLAGEVSADELRRQQRRIGMWFTLYLTIALGLVAGVAGWLPSLVFRMLPEPPRSLAVFCVLIGALAGALVGLWFDRTMWRHATEGLIRLVAAVDAPGLKPIPEPREGQCPTCGAENSGPFWTRNSPMILNLRFNPGFAFIELVLGHRMPSTIRRCHECGIGFINCPSCHRSFGEDITLSRTQAFRAFFFQPRGYPCARCGEPLPCYQNVLSAAIRRMLGRHDGPPAQRRQPS